MINVVLKGHDYQYEIGELIKTFEMSKEVRFINEEQIFNIMNELTEGLLLINELTNINNDYTIVTRIYKNENLISFNETKYKGYDNSIKNRKELKRHIKINIYDALMRAKPSSVPWGILTGIRPTKIVHEYLDKNFTINEIKNILSKNYCLANEKIELITEIAMRERKFIYPVNKNLVSLYISIPFCPTRCVYCSFPSNTVNKGSQIISTYLKALQREIHSIGKILNEQNKKVETIYIGGGTPTTLSALQLDILIKEILNTFDVSELKEFTVEAGRPDTITKDKLLVLKNNCVDRISINPQTMNQETLNCIGRLHKVTDIQKAYYEAKQIGFKTINMDIIIGLPNEGVNHIKNTLEKIMELSPENLTVHTLAIKRSSKLNENMEKFKITDDSLANDMLALTKIYADKMNLHPYYMYRQKYMVGNLENIGYCIDGHECIYNIQIMEERQTIIALGAGGASKIVYPDENRLERIANVKNVNEYILRIEEMIERKRRQLM